MDVPTLTPNKQVKLQYWLNVTRQYRASGLMNQTWCEQHDIFSRSYYYRAAKTWKLAPEELLGKSYGCGPVTERTVLLPDVTPESTGIFLRDRQDSCVDPAAVFHTDTVTADLFENTSRELLEAILKIVRSCWTTSPG